MESKIIISPLETIINQFIKDFNLFCSDIFNEEKIKDKLKIAVKNGIVIEKLSKEALKRKSKGYYDSKNKKIGVSNDAKNQYEVNKTIFHELLHALSLNLENDLTGFVSVYGRKAKFLDEGIVTIIEQKYDEYYNPDTKKEGRNTNGYFIYKIIKQLELILGKNLFVYFFKKPQGLENELGTFIYSNNSLEENNINLYTNIMDFENIKKYFQKGQSNNTNLKKVMTYVESFFHYINKNPENSVNKIFQIENIFTSQLIYQLIINKVNIEESLTLLERLLNIQNYSNFDLYYDFLKQTINNLEELNDYPELKNLYIFMSAFYNNDENTLKKTEIRNKDRFLAIKIINHLDSVNINQNIETNFFDKYFNYLAAVKGYLNSSLSFYEIFDNFFIYEIVPGIESISEDYYKDNRQKKNLYSSFRKFIKPTYFIDGKKRIIVYNDMIYECVSIDEYIELLNQNIDNYKKYIKFLKDFMNYVLENNIYDCLININNISTIYYIKNNQVIKYDIFTKQKEEYNIDNAHKEILELSKVPDYN